METLLLNPPLFDATEYGKPPLLSAGAPLGLAYIGAFAKKEGYNVRVNDLYFWPWDKVRRYLRTEKPKIVGITCLTEGRWNAFKLAKLAKEANDSIKVVMGGHHATYMYEQILRHYPEVDVIVMGEGEITFAELLRAWDQGCDIDRVDGIAYRDKKREIIKTSRRTPLKDLDQLPFPLYEDIDFDNYPRFKVLYPHFAKIRVNGLSVGDRKYASVIGSRGCPFKCQFCSTAVFWRNKWRCRSSANILEEIEMLYYDFGIRHINFADDTFTVKPERTIGICQGIVKKHLNLSWDCTTRVDYVTPEMVKCMKEAGCVFTSLGVESGSEKILRTINKEIDIKRVFETFKLFKDVGIIPYPLLMVGNPGESEETIKETIRLLKTIRPSFTGVSKTMIFPETALYQLAKKQGFLDDYYWLTKLPPPYYTVEHELSQLETWVSQILLANASFWRKTLEKVLCWLKPLRNLITLKTGIKITRVGVRIVRHHVRNEGR